MFPARSEAAGSRSKSDYPQRMDAGDRLPPWVIEPASGLPPEAFDLSICTLRNVLAHGPLDTTLREALLGGNVAQTGIDDGAEALRALAWTTFDAVLIAPTMPDGLALAKALKVGTPLGSESREETERAALRPRTKPVFLLPRPGEVEYAVIVVAQSVSFLERTDRVSLPRAVLFHDFARLPEVAKRTSFTWPGVA